MRYGSNGDLNGLTEHLNRFNYQTFLSSLALPYKF